MDLYDLSAAPIIVSGVSGTPISDNNSVNVENQRVSKMEISTTIAISHAKTNPAYKPIRRRKHLGSKIDESLSKKTRVSSTSSSTNTNESSINDTDSTVSNMNDTNNDTNSSKINNSSNDSNNDTDNDSNNYTNNETNIT